MAWFNGKEGDWITTDTGRHVFIPKGEDTEKYLKKFFDEEYRGESKGPAFDKDTIYYRSYAGHLEEVSEDYYKENFNSYVDVGEIEITPELAELFDKYISEEMVDKYTFKELSLKFYDDTYELGLSSNKRNLLSRILRDKVKDLYKQKGERILAKIPKTKATTPDECKKTVNLDNYLKSREAKYNSKEFNDYTSNCQRCVIAYEMRRRGYDVQADKYDKSDELGIWHNNIKRSFIDFDDIMVHTYERNQWGEPFNSRSQLIKQMEKDMLSEGEGARFIVEWDWKKFRSGHTINAEVIDGKLKFIDSQDSTEYDTKWLIDNKYIRATTLNFVRVDKLNLSGNTKGVVTYGDK